MKRFEGFLAGIMGTWGVTNIVAILVYAPQTVEETFKWEPHFFADALAFWIVGTSFVAFIGAILLFVCEIPARATSQPERKSE